MIDFLVGPQLLTPLAQKVTDAIVKICKDFKAVCVLKLFDQQMNTNYSPELVNAKGRI